ncbi:MAG: WG repeat-containing protein [Treponema sp.]|jgi:hypothetical protein|nr:WG repeat-containing protein [Treponema sp.]
MKYQIGALIVIFCLIFWAACRTESTEMTNAGRNLIPFVKLNPEGDRIWGYLDEDTEEIVIEAKYDIAYPFVGNFAEVTERDTWRTIIIDKDENVVQTPQFHYIYLIASENGKNTVAILRKGYSRTKFQIGFIPLPVPGSPPTGFYTETYHKYRLVNLVTGKTIIPERENYLLSSTEVIGDYLLVDKYLYRFMDNGSVKRVAGNNSGLAVRILNEYFAERGISLTAGISRTSYQTIENIRIDYEQYRKEHYADPDFSEALNDFSPKFTLLLQDWVRPFHRDPSVFLNAPLEIGDRRYWLTFYSRKDEPYARAEGLYNETKKEWELKPYFIDTVTGELDYLIDILPTNNPHFVHIVYRNQNTEILTGGIFDLNTNCYVNAHLYSSYDSYSYYDMIKDRERLGRTFPDTGIGYYCRK